MQTREQAAVLLSPAAGAGRHLFHSVKALAQLRYFNNGLKYVERGAKTLRYSQAGFDFWNKTNTCQDRLNRPRVTHVVVCFVMPGGRA